MPSPVHELTRKASDVARILELTVQGVDAADITRRTRYHHVQAIQYAHGYPNLERVREMWLQLRMLHDMEVTFDVEAPLAALGAQAQAAEVAS